ncbi:M42 family metallopeptidase [Alicyclobacillus dauci]|uniref:M42 family metallopeptidase n=1 Tax=Alicyclobacillus dauci TaxID=1475485 RepID=A0ABY6Z5K3_9BACL|nr:M42 family metallopeptidase [Alicyclobacillus dauci]WAH37803.1 M42 family metallopeptidase [Alicyclobacillus dauci]
MLELLRDLTDLVGPCGFEHDIARYIVNRVRPFADETKVDGVGNVIVTKRGAHPGPTLVISTHMDEVGFIVKKIEQNGLIRFEKLGGHDDRILLAQRVKIRTQTGVIPGVIGTISAHMTKFDDPSKVRKHAQLYIDVGATDREEVLALGVSIGDPISWATDLQQLGNSRIMGKSLDDRAGCAVLLSALEDIDFSHVRGTICAVFSVQEEVGLRGARVAAASVDADVALAIDTTAVSDTPEEMMDETLSLGNGPGIKVMDFSLVASSAVRRQLVAVAQAGDIPFQLEVFPGIGTDAGELALGNSGVPAGVLSIPSRYAHSPVELIDLHDLENTKKLLIEFIASLQSKEQFAFIAT